MYPRATLFIFIVILACVSGCLAQSPFVIEPLVTVRPQALEILNEQGIHTNTNVDRHLLGFKYEKGSGSVIFYKGGCSVDIEKQFSLSTDTVLMLREKPGAVTLKDSLLGGFYTNHSREIQLADGSTLYIDGIRGFAFTSGPSRDEPEIARMIYRIPLNRDLPECLVSQLDPDVQKAYMSPK